MYRPLTLLITSKSDCEIPGPPLRGILSPPYPSYSQQRSKKTEQQAVGSAHRDVDDIDDIVRELARVIGGEVVTAALDEQELAAILRLERLERTHVRADVLADRGVRAAAGLDCEDARRRERLVLDQELLVLLGEDVVGNRRCRGRKSGWLA